MADARRGGVLVVDDEYLIAIHIAAVVDEAGLPVCGIANSGTTALALAADARPVAAVLDIRLGPGPDGIDVAERLRALCGCGIVFVSGSGEREVMDRALAIDGAQFLQKPVVPDQLVRALRQVTGDRAGVA